MSKLLHHSIPCHLVVFRTGWLDSWSGYFHSAHIHPLAGHNLALERRSGDGLIGKQDIDNILAGLCWPITDITGAVSLVKALNLRLGWSLNGQSQSTTTGLAGIDGELGGGVGSTTVKSRSVRLHFSGVANHRSRGLIRNSFHDPGRSGHGLTSERNLDGVGTRLERGEFGREAVDRFVHSCGHDLTSRANDGHLDVTLTGSSSDDVKVDFFSDWDLCLGVKQATLTNQSDKTADSSDTEKFDRKRESKFTCRRV